MYADMGTRTGLVPNRAVPLTEIHARSDLHNDDRRDDKVHRHAKRGPPARVGDEVSVVLPEILEPMADESDYEEPGRFGDCRGGHDNEGVSARTDSGAPGSTCGMELSLLARRRT
jgi:hypothetical protein